MFELKRKRDILPLLIFLDTRNAQKLFLMLRNLVRDILNKFLVHFCIFLEKTAFLGISYAMFFKLPDRTGICHCKLWTAENKTGVTETRAVAEI